MANNESFVLFTENRDVFDDLPDAECAALIRAIFQYEDEGTVPELEGSVKYVFMMIKKTLDRNNEKYEKVKEARSKAGKASAEARRNANAEAHNEQTSTDVNKQEQTPTNQAVNVNVNVNGLKEKENIKKKKRESDADFEALWELYPRKNGKKDAKRHYLAAVADGATFEEVKTGIEAYKRYIKKTGTEPKYVKMGSSFFCQRSWADDWSVKDASQGGNSPPGYKPFKKEDYERDDFQASEMPDGFRDKLNGLFGS